jgi:hypothetical protein
MGKKYRLTIRIDGERWLLLRLDKCRQMAM